MDERRIRRSSDPLIALHYQLASARSRADLDAIVVADPAGVVVAGAGPWPVCEELAAYAPLLVDTATGASSVVSSRVDALRNEVEVVPVTVGGQEVLLCSRLKPKATRGETWQRDLDEAARGVSRILSTAA